MTKVNVVVYHNEDGRLWSYTPGDRLTRVLNVELDMPEGFGQHNISVLLEQLWCGLNFTGEIPEEWWARLYFGWDANGENRRMELTHRSLCMGDVIVLGETAWKVASVGFEQIALPGGLGAFDGDRPAAAG